MSSRRSDSCRAGGLVRAEAREGGITRSVRADHVLGSASLMKRTGFLLAGLLSVCCGDVRGPAEGRLEAAPWPRRGSQLPVLEEVLLEIFPTMRRNSGKGVLQEISEITGICVVAVRSTFKAIFTPPPYLFEWSCRWIDMQNDKKKRSPSGLVNSWFGR